MEIVWLKETLFAGMTANAFKSGTALSLGWFWMRVGGCSVLYRGSSIEQVDFTNIAATANEEAYEISPPSYLRHNNDSTYVYVVRRANRCGDLERTLSAATEVSINANSDLVPAQPNNIFFVKAEQVSGNRVRLVWYYCPIEQRSKPRYFRIYWDGGNGRIDYENPVAVVGYAGRIFHSYRTGALVSGTYLFCIKAQDGNGQESKSSLCLSIQVNITGPQQADLLEVEAA